MKRLVIFIFLPLLAACDDDTALSSNPIDSNIIIEARETLGPGSRSLTLFCQTGKVYPCINYQILTEQHLGESSARITFTAVDLGLICFTALGPATVLVDLNKVSNGEYELELNNANLKNKGTLRVTEEEIALLFSQQNGIEFVRTHTRRVPEKTYWGYIGYHEASSAALAAEFLQKLADQGVEFGKQTPGHYFYYEIDDSGEIIATAENSGYHFIKGFIFQYSGDETALRDLVQIDGKTYRDDLSISVSTYKGEQFYNWDN